MEIVSHGKHINVPPPHVGLAPAKDGAEPMQGGDEVHRIDEAMPGRLMARLQDARNVRSRVLAEIQAKVQAGEYSTRAAWERAAEQIVGL